MSLTSTGVSEQFAEIYIGHYGVVRINCSHKISLNIKKNPKDLSASEIISILKSLSHTM